MSLLDYGSRLQGSLGRYGRDIGTFKDSVFEDKMESIQKLFSPEITSTAQQLTDLNNIKTNIDNALGGTASGLEAVGSAVGVKKLYGAIKEKLSGKSLADKKEVNETAEESNTGETDMERAFGTETEQSEIPDWLKPAFKNAGSSEEGGGGGSNALEDLFGNVKDTFNNIKSSVGDRMNQLQGQVQDRVDQMRGGESEDAPQEVEMSEMTTPESEMKTPEERAFGTEAEQNEPADWLDNVDTSISKGTGSTLGEDETETLGQNAFTGGLGRSTQAGSGNLLKPTGATRPVPQGQTTENPTQVTSAENVSGDVDDVANGLKDTETALEGAEEAEEGVEAATTVADVASNFLDAIPVVGAVLGIGLQVGTAIYSGVEEGNEQSLEAKEEQEQSEEKSAEEQARDAIKTNTSFTGSTVVPTFSSLANMGGGQGVF